MSALSGFAMHERAALLGMSTRAYLELIDSDSRIVACATLPTDGSIARLRHWIAEGQPELPLSALSYIGGPVVERALKEVLEKLPAPVRHHALSVIGFVGIEPHEGGWSSSAWPEAREHMVALRTENLGSIAHEIAHSWHRELADPGTPQRTAQEVEIRAKHYGGILAQASVEAGTVDELVRKSLRIERIADASATCWGFPINTIHQARIDHTRAEIYRLAESAQKDCNENRNDET